MEAERLEKLRKEMEEKGLNISSDTLFLAIELREGLRELRNFLLWGIGILVTLEVGFGIAILALLP
ncbi:hypothetical protein M1N58_01215 [Dehalococcoidales bacterium]|nr:hypothetical protein [Dehalococcoidales bacterium]